MVYLRLCLIQNLEVPLTRDIIKHPCEFTPVIRNEIQKLYSDKEAIDKNALLQYVSLIRQLFIANPGILTLKQFKHILFKCKLL